MYSTCASAYWTLVEGIYLAGKISILALKSDVPCIFYTLVGWGKCSCFQSEYTFSKTVLWSQVFLCCALSHGELSWNCPTLNRVGCLTVAAVTGGY